MPRRHEPKLCVIRQRCLDIDDDIETGICTTNGSNNNEHLTRSDGLGAKTINDANKNTAEARNHLPNGIGFTKNTTHLRRTEFAPYKRRTVPRDSQHRVTRSASRPEVNCGLSDDNDLDDDGFFVKDCHQTSSYKHPSNVSADYADSSPRALPNSHRSLVRQCLPFGNPKQPDEVNELYIPHDYQTDSEIGDKFGAVLKTYKYSSKYNQHLLCDVSHGGPADQMKIQNWDELILVNNVFVPDLNHTAVLNLFHDVKVDGKTRFSLVTRRRRSEHDKKYKWQWFETSALLFPDKRESHGIKEPTIKKLHYQPLENNRYEHKTWCRLNVEGTQLYLDVNTSGVKTAVLRDDTRDETKNIMQWSVYRENPVTHFPEFVASLCGHTEASYVTVQNISIGVSNSPQWFLFRTLGSSVSFKKEDNSRYIGFDMSDRRLTAQAKEFYFKRVPLDHDRDSTDSGLSDVLPLSSLSSTASSDSSTSFLSSRSSSNAVSFESDLEMDSSGYESSSPKNSMNASSVVQCEDMDTVGTMTHPSADMDMECRRITRSMSRQTSTTMHVFDNLAIS